MGITGMSQAHLSGLKHSGGRRLHANIPANGQALIPLTLPMIRPNGGENALHKSFID